MSTSYARGLFVCWALTTNWRRILDTRKTNDFYSRKAVDAAMGNNDTSHGTCKPTVNIRKLQATWVKEPMRAFGNSTTLETPRVAHLCVTAG